MTDDERKRMLSAADEHMRMMRAAADHQSQQYGMVVSGGADTGMADTLKSAFAKGAMGLDYLGGRVRADIARDLGVPVDEAELEKAKNLEAGYPSSAQYMEKAGVPEMGRLSDVVTGTYAGMDNKRYPLVPKGGATDITGRGALGFVGDIATDPATYMSGGVKGVVGSGVKGAGEDVLKSAGAKALRNEAEYGALPWLKDKAVGGMGLLEAATTGPSNALSRIGERTRAKALTPIILAMPPSAQPHALDVFNKYKISGSPQTIYNKLGKAQMLAESGQKRIFAKANQLGVTVDAVDLFQPLEKKLQKMEKDGLITTKDRVDIYHDLTHPMFEMGETVQVPKARYYPGTNELINLGYTVPQKVYTHDRVPIDIANKWKASFTKGVPDSVWQKIRSPTAKKDLELTAAEGIRNGMLKGLENFGDKNAEKLAGELSEINRDWHVLLSAEKKAGSLAKAAPASTSPGIVDQMLGLGTMGSALFGGGEHGLPPLVTAVALGGTLAAKKGIEAMTKSPSRSYYGSLLRDVMEHPISGSGVDSAYRRGLITVGKGIQDEKNK